MFGLCFWWQLVCKFAIVVKNLDWLLAYQKLSFFLSSNVCVYFVLSYLIDVVSTLSYCITYIIISLQLFLFLKLANHILQYRQASLHTINYIDRISVRHYTFNYPIIYQAIVYSVDNSDTHQWWMCEIILMSTVEDYSMSIFFNFLYRWYIHLIYEMLRAFIW